LLLNKAILSIRRFTPMSADSPSLDLSPSMRVHLRPNPASTLLHDRGMARWKRQGFHRNTLGTRFL
jgi:hypothetical protein